MWYIELSRSRIPTSTWRTHFIVHSAVSSEWFPISTLFTLDPLICKTKALLWGQIWGCCCYQSEVWQINSADASRGTVTPPRRIWVACRVDSHKFSYSYRGHVYIDLSEETNVRRFANHFTHFQWCMTTSCSLGKFQTTSLFSKEIPDRGKDELGLQGAIHNLCWFDFKACLNGFSKSHKLTLCSDFGFVSVQQRNDINVLPVLHYSSDLPDRSLSLWTFHFLWEHNGSRQDTKVQSSSTQTPRSWAISPPLCTHTGQGAGVILVHIKVWGWNDTEIAWFVWQLHWR